MSSDAMCIGLYASIRYIAGLYGLFHVKKHRFPLSLKLSTARL